MADTADKDATKRLVKFMGYADAQVIPAGWNDNGGLADGVPGEVRWDKTNNRIVDLAAAGWDDDQIDALLDHRDDFLDVTNRKRIPHSEFEKAFLGVNAITSVDDPRVRLPQLVENVAPGGVAGNLAPAGNSTGLSGGDTGGTPTLGGSGSD